MEKACTEKRFLGDVKEHKMEILVNNGTTRHLRFAKEERSNYAFNLVTWEGSLCISGDCGTFVFSRTKDMFGFFRMDSSDFNFSSKKQLQINPCYWGEKLTSESRFGGYKEFSEELCINAVKEHFKQWDFDDWGHMRKAWIDVKENVVDNICDGEHLIRNLDMIMEYRSEDGQDFSEFYENCLEEDTFHYLWCLYAIVWGIKQYDLETRGEK